MPLFRLTMLTVALSCLWLQGCGGCAGPSAFLPVLPPPQGGEGAAELEVLTGGPLEASLDSIVAVRYRASGPEGARVDVFQDKERADADVSDDEPLLEDIALGEDQKLVYDGGRLERGYYLIFVMTRDGQELARANIRVHVHRRSFVAFMGAMDDGNYDLFADTAPDGSIVTAGTYGDAARLPDGRVVPAGDEPVNAWVSSYRHERSWFRRLNARSLIRDLDVGDDGMIYVTGVFVDRLEIFDGDRLVYSQDGPEIINGFLLAMSSDGAVRWMRLVVRGPGALPAIPTLLVAARHDVGGAVLIARGPDALRINAGRADEEVLQVDPGAVAQGQVVYDKQGDVLAVGRIGNVLNGVRFMDATSLPNGRTLVGAGFGARALVVWLDARLEVEKSESVTSFGARERPDRIAVAAHDDGGVTFVCELHPGGEDIVLGDPPVYRLPAGEVETAIVRYDAHGKIRWVRRTKTLSTDSPTPLSLRVAPRPDGGVVIAQNALGLARYEDVRPLVTLGASAHLLVMDGDGDLVRQRLLGGRGDQYLKALATHADGSIVLALSLEDEASLFGRGHQAPPYAALVWTNADGEVDPGAPGDI